MTKRMRNVSIIKKVGVEVEGCFSETPHIQGWQTKADGSVNDVGGFSAWEIASEPVAFGSREKLFADIARLGGVNPLNGEEFYVRDRSAGLHAHISVRQEFLPFLNSQRLMRRIVRRIMKDARVSQDAKDELNKRLELRHVSSDSEFRGQGRRQGYCWHDARREGFENLFNGGDRYAAVNFMALFAHGTVEFRFLPTAKPAEMVAMLEILFNEAEAHLQKVRLRAAAANMTVPDYSAYVMKVTAARALKASGRMDAEPLLEIMIKREG